MSEEFSIDLGGLKRKEKASNEQIIDQLDHVAEEQGFVPRNPPKKRGRKPSPRKGQVHAKVLPHISQEISNESRRRGVQQGVLIEEAWDLYKKEHNL